MSTLRARHFSKIKGKCQCNQGKESELSKEKVGTIEGERKHIRNFSGCFQMGKAWDGGEEGLVGCEDCE